MPLGGAGTYLTVNAANDTTDHTDNMKRTLSHSFNDESCGISVPP